MTTKTPSASRTGATPTRESRSRSSTTAVSASTPATAPTASQRCSTPTATRSSHPAEDGWTRSSTPSGPAPRARSATPWAATRTGPTSTGTGPARQRSKSPVTVPTGSPARSRCWRADGSPVERAEGASNEHYALCRCGQSRNKPYCSGMHWYVGFKDPQPASAANRTIYEAAGGMPALTRMTSMFYEKLAADDPLLAPLYATIPPSEPERLARELAWLTGAGTDRPEHPGLLPTRVTRHPHRRGPGTLGRADVPRRPTSPTCRTAGVSRDPPREPRPLQPHRHPGRPEPLHLGQTTIRHPQNIRNTKARPPSNFPRPASRSASRRTSSRCSATAIAPR